MSAASVMLVAMPWETLPKPSIQLGILRSVLERAAIPTEVRSLKLAFMEHCLAATAGRPKPEQFRLADYEAVATEQFAFGVGDWIFAVPPFSNSSEPDEHYLAFLRHKGFADTDIAKALAMRALVPSFLENCVQEILAVGPRIVGFTSTFSQNVASLVLAKLLKTRDPSLKIILGGANCEGPMGAALHRAFPWVDVVVRGEAERVLPELVRDLLGGGPIRPQPGLCYRNGAPSVAVAPATELVPMDEVPPPNFDEYFERLEKTSFYSEILPEVRLLYESSRGCWWGAKSHCTFCGLNGSTMEFRSKSPDRVVEEIMSLAKRYRRLDFQIVDNILDRHYFTDVLPKLRQAGHNISLFYETKANLKREEVQLLKEAGVDTIQPGLETLSTPILKLIRKGVSAFQNVRLLKWCAQYGIHVYWNLIYGIAGEPVEEYARMAELIPSLTHLQPPTMGCIVLDRFSPYQQRPGDFGLELVGPLPHYRFIYPVDQATLADLAYAFEYRHADGRDPEIYVEPVRRAVEVWHANRETAFRSLRYRRGPGFLTVNDRRPNLEKADYSFGEPEALIYLACEDGATPRDAHVALCAAGMTDISLEDVEDFLDELLALRLAFEEDGRYLTLALPVNLPEKF